MAWQAYTAATTWFFSVAPGGGGQDPRGVVPLGHVVVLDDVSEGPTALAAGEVSGVATLTSDQQTALASLQGCADRAAVVVALDLS